MRGTKYRAYAQSSKAGLALTKIQPTTIAGVFALLKHIKEFNAGEVWLAETRGLPRQINGILGRSSGPGMNGPEINMFGYKILENVLKALTV